MSDTYNSGIESFRRSYEICPIFLVDGIASQGSGGIPGAGLPITSILQSSIYPQGVTGDASSSGSASDATDSLDGYFAHFALEEGQTYIDNEIAEYPFGNMAVAANAVIAQPVEISLRMVCPANSARGVTYPNKQAIITSLVSSLQQHIDLGGYFVVATPAYIYSDGVLLLKLEDGGDYEEGGQVQHTIIWRFRAPLLSTQQAAGAQNALTNKISSQVQTQGDPPGTPASTAAVGDPGSNVIQNVVPAAAAPLASNVSQQLTNSTIQQISGIAPVLPGNGGTIFQQATSALQNSAQSLVQEQLQMLLAAATVPNPTLLGLVSGAQP